MQKIILLSFFLVSGFFSSGFLSLAQDHTVVSDNNAVTRDAKGFHAVEVSGGIDLYLNSGNEEAVAVSASDHTIRDHIRTEVEKGVLKIYLDNKDGHWNAGGTKMKAYVSFKQLDAIEASGGSDVFEQGVLKGERLAIRLSGGGGFKGELNVTDLSVVQSGGSDVNATGTVGNLNIENSGGGSFKGYELAADFGHVNASGGGHIRLTVNKELFVVASGGSGVYYKGNGVVKSVSSSGGSEVHRKE